MTKKKEIELRKKIHLSLKRNNKAILIGSKTCVEEALKNYFSYELNQKKNAQAKHKKIIKERNEIVLLSVFEASGVILIIRVSFSSSFMTSYTQTTMR